MTNRERCSERVSSASEGRCAMSMVLLLQVLRRPPYDAVRGGGAGSGGYLSPRRSRWPPAGSRRERASGGGQGVLLLLRVELDDQLFLDRRVDDLPGRDAVDQHAQLAADDLQPGRHGALAG